jgi:hypothetical protein
MKLRNSSRVTRKGTGRTVGSIDTENALNQYRCNKYVPEFQKLLTNKHVIAELGARAVTTLRELSDLIVPAVSKDGAISVEPTPAEQPSIPLWFADESIRVDYLPIVAKDPNLQDIFASTVSDDALAAFRHVCYKEYTFSYVSPGGYTLEYGKSPIILLFSGHFGATMSSVMCHELIHARQILDGKFDTTLNDEDTIASGELEAYYYQAKFEKGLQNSRHIDFSVFGISGLAQKINFIRHKHARRGEPFTVTPRMKQELIARGLGSSVFTMSHQESIEKTD